MATRLYSNPVYIVYIVILFKPASKGFLFLLANQEKGRACDVTLLDNNFMVSVNLEVEADLKCNLVLRVCRVM